MLVDGTQLDSVRALLLRAVAVPTMGSRLTVMVRMCVLVNMRVAPMGVAGFARRVSNACSTGAFGPNARLRTIARVATPVIMPATRHRRCHQVGNEHNACCQVLEGCRDHDDQMLLQFS